MRFSQEWIQGLKAAINLVDVVSENVDLKRSGQRFMGRCPFHGDRSPSFSVSTDFFHCFGCKESGDAIAFLMKLHGLSFEESLEDLAERAQIPLPVQDAKTSAEERIALEKRARIQKAARLNYFVALKYFQDQLKRHQGSKHEGGPVKYLESRAISNEWLERFQVGFAPDSYEGLVQFLNQAKAPLDLARDVGLIRPSQKKSGDFDLFRGRIMFPLIDLRGRVCGFGGRILPEIQARLERSGEKLPKYLNSTESDLFHKSKFLYGLFQGKKAIRESEVVYVVEGYFDVIALHQAGFENVVAPCGTALTEDHLKTLGRLAKKIVMFFDQDEAGQGATVKSMEMALKNGVILHGFQYPSSKDPDEFLKENPKDGIQILKNGFENTFPLLDHAIERLMKESEGDVEGRSNAIKQVVRWMGMFEDPVGRAVRQKWVCETFGVPESVFPGVLKVAPPSATVASDGGPTSHHQGQDQRSAVDRRPKPQRKNMGPSSRDKKILHLLLNFNEYGEYFLELRHHLPEKDSFYALFDDTSLQRLLFKISKEPDSIEIFRETSRLIQAFEIPNELQGLIIELQMTPVPKELEDQAQKLLLNGLVRVWARFSLRIQKDLLIADQAQDVEKVKELSKQYLDAQRKTKELETLYVTGNSDQGE